MRQFELVERVQAYAPEADEALLNKAYVYAMKAHSHQQRASGDPYFSHPLEVAAILTELKLDDATIATALLHDVIEDTEATRTEIDALFGGQIGGLVDGLTKIKKLDLVSKQAQQAENFRKLLIAISSDVRVLLVKLADRLHNMRTLEHMKPASRERISQETLEIYAPLAGRMGMQAMREEFEDLSFRWLWPDAYETLNAKLDALGVRNSNLVDEISHAVTDLLGDIGITASVSGRSKRPYSIWRKMENKKISLEQLSDIYGFRVIVETVDQCYQVLGAVHTRWPAVPGRFKDYISTPKQNDYRSIHTTVVGPQHQRVELQIRTRDMHSIAEYGIAAHAFYKDQTRTEPECAVRSAKISSDNGPYLRLRRLVETLLDGNTPQEFLEHTKLELFQDQVFCFTPKGRLIALPRGANSIDFAYAVHTDVGNSATGTIINGRHMPIATPLNNGDEVEILTKDGQSPPAAWERVAVTGRARAAIRRAARDAIRKQYCELGRRLLSARLKQHSLTYSDDLVTDALPRLGHRTLEDALAAVGRNELPIDDALRALAPDTPIKVRPPPYRPRNRHDHGHGQDGWFNLAKVIGLKFRDTTPPGSNRNAHAPGVPIRGLKDDIPVTFDEAGAVPGDRIVGVMIPGEGLRIFQIHSPKLSDFEHRRWIDVTWDIDPAKPERFPARISVTARNEPGALARIAGLIGEQDGNIDNLSMAYRAADFTRMWVEIEVWDLSHLTTIISGLRALPEVSVVERVFDRAQ